jgi:hypothetical protein
MRWVIGGRLKLKADKTPSAKRVRKRFFFSLCRLTDRKTSGSIVTIAMIAAENPTVMLQFCLRRLYEREKSVAVLFGAGDSVYRVGCRM